MLCAFVELDDQVCVTLASMGEYNSAIHEELEIFRWSLYNAKKEDAKEKQKSLLDEACHKPIYEPFIEECMIANCDLKMVNDIHLFLSVSFDKLSSPIFTAILPISMFPLISSPI